MLTYIKQFFKAVWDSMQESARLRAEFHTKHGTRYY
jgi:hypothetical protein